MTQRLWLQMRLWFIIISLSILALMIQWLPMPYWLHLGKPDLVLLMLLYWVMAYPQYLSMGFGWVMSIGLDIATGLPLGSHGFGFVIGIYLALSFYARFAIFTMWQQSVWIAIVLGLHRMIIYSLQIDYPWQSVVLSFIVHACLWPAMVYLLAVLKWLVIDKYQTGLQST